MFSPETYRNRRQLLLSSLHNGLILIMGNIHSPRNYKGNTYPFRQDSNFLYFAGIDLPGLALTIDAQSGKATLYGDDLSLEDTIWTGPQPGLAEWASRSGIEQVKSSKELLTAIKKTSHIHFLPAYPFERKLFLSEVMALPVSELANRHSIPLIEAIVQQRSIKSEEEVAQIEDALNRATGKLHVEAMRMANAGIYEYEIAGQIESTMLRNNCTPAYGIICSVRGEVLHNEYYHNKLETGQMLLIDAGAENAMHYASDLTRTVPVGRRFSSRQKAIYTIVLNALNQSIAAIRPGVPYREIHLQAARIIATGLKEAGLMKGDINEAVAQGAHALFFPHGLGHMMGLDVHDMEDLGENYVGYDATVQRSSQFGTAYLRLARTLQTGFTLTVEPGIYFIPTLIKMWKNEKKFEAFINYIEVEKYLDFGGIRIEDNVLVTEQAGRILGKPVPKSIEEIESL
ncbi:MAG: aminopeptidase P family protein [Bacteroidota bacterium]|nr:MAG: aminopeptidase P family protein [Bacteroidota bacterium]